MAHPATERGLRAPLLRRGPDRVPAGTRTNESVRIVDLIGDPREARTVGELPTTWTQLPAMGVVTDLARSRALSPDVPVGAPDDDRPPDEAVEAWSDR